MWRFDCTCGAPFVEIAHDYEAGVYARGCAIRVPTPQTITVRCAAGHELQAVDAKRDKSGYRFKFEGWS